MSKPRPIEDQVRNMAIWQAQAIAVLKRALRHPGVLAEAVIDPGGPTEYLLEVVAHERSKLILPIDDEPEGGENE